MSFAPHQPTVDPRGPFPYRDPVINLPFTRTEEDRAMERLEQKRQWEQQIKDRLGNIMGGGKPRMAGEAIGVDAAAAAEGNKVGEAVGSTVGGLAGGAALGLLDGPAPVLDIVGSTIGSQIGGAIGAHIPQLPTAQANQDAMLTGQHQQLISARDPRSQGKLPLGLAGTAFDPENYKVY